MKNLLKKLIQVAFGVNAQARQSADEQVRRAVESFYAAFNAHDFARAAEFTTDDWEHINPFGGRTRGAKKCSKNYARCTARS
jgi:ketosteroid isomerase-like protein